MLYIVESERRIVLWLEAAAKIVEFVTAAIHLNVVHYTLPRAPPLLLPSILILFFFAANTSWLVGFLC